MREAVRVSRKRCVSKNVQLGGTQACSCLCTGVLLRVTDNNQCSPLCPWPSGAQAKPRRKKETCLQLPCHSYPFTNSQVNYLQRQQFPQFVIVSNSSKNVWFLIHYFVLQCCKAWPLNLSHSFCNNYPTLSVGRLKTQRILSVLCNVIFSTSQQKPDRLMITPLGKRR